MFGPKVRCHFEVCGAPYGQNRFAIKSGQMVELFFLVALPGHHDADRESSHEEASQPDAVLAADHVTEGSERKLNGGDGQNGAK